MTHISLSRSLDLLSRLPAGLSAGLLVLALCGTPLAAQFRIHDAQREAAAQEAKKAAEKIKSGEVFKKQSQNLQTLIERDLATAVADARVEMQASVNRLRQWSDVEDLSSIIGGIAVPAAPEDIAARKAKIAKMKTDLKAQVKSLSDAAAEDAADLQPLIDSLGDLDTALKFADEHVGVNDPSVTSALGVLDKLQGLYKSYQNQFDAVNKAAKGLSELKINMKKALLARLKVEEDSLTTEVGLYARGEKELKAVQHWQAQCAVPSGVQKEELIDETLDRLATNRDALERAVRALYACGSLAAEGMLPRRLLRLRLAQLDHLRSIQISAANARVYEAVLGGGVERLALFYQGGVKPETLAQILQSLSAAGIFGKLLTQ